MPTLGILANTPTADTTLPSRRILRVVLDPLLRAIDAIPGVLLFYSCYGYAVHDHQAVSACHAIGDLLESKSPLVKPMGSRWFQLAAGTYAMIARILPLSHHHGGYYHYHLLQDRTRQSYAIAFDMQRRSAPHLA